MRPDSGQPAPTGSRGKSSSSGSSSSSRRSDPSSTYEGHSWKQHVAGEGKLIDNKLRDKLLSYIGASGVGSSDGDRASRQFRRAKREDIFSDDNTKNFFGNRISDERREEEIPRITEQVLPIDNLTDDRIREEAELLEHLNREHFPDAAISPSDTDDNDADAATSRKKHPGGGGKKGRRRKGHKKKIKRIKPASSDLSSHGHAELLLLPPERDPSLPGGGRSDGITELSLNESEQQNQKSSRKKHRQKAKLTAGGDLPARKSFDVPVAAAAVDGNWDRKAGRELVVLNSDDIYDKNMQITVQSDARPAAVTFPDEGSSGWGRKQQQQPEKQNQKDQLQRKLTPAERKKLQREHKKQLAEQRKQLKKFKQGNLMLAPLAPQQLQQLPPAPATDPSPGVSSVTFASDDMQRTEAVSVQRIVIAGDLSCMKNDFIPAPAIPNADIKYLRNDIYGLENSFLEAEYHCRLGFELRFQNASRTNSLNLICRKSRWIGKRPSCVRIKESSRTTIAATTTTTTTENVVPAGVIVTNGSRLCGRTHNCQQACHKPANGTRVCSCFKGFRMVVGRCVDINECTEYGEDVCEYGCSNTVGSFTCKCPKGLRVTDNNKCMDVNECLLRNGHGPCQDTCINTWSGYRCSCSGLPGTRLGEDGHSCEDIDECTVNNGGCSHTCLNTLGRAFCVCPEGYMLDDDWKTCIDIDECSNQKSIRQEFRCRGSCINTVGSFRCLNEEGDDDDDQEDEGVDRRRGRTRMDGGADQLTKQSDELDDENDDTLCPSGYYFNTTMGDCQDTNECDLGNAGCQHHCVNSDGSFYCSCKYGFKLDADKHSCLVLNDSLKLADVACPPLFPPRHGYLECSRPIDEISDGPNGGKLKIINRPGSQCILKCPTGYRLEGKFSKICGTSGEWIGDESGTCIRYPQPRLTCPSGVNVELHPNDTDHTTVKLRRPKTDVSWDRDVVAEPYWAKKDVLQLPLGSINISYTAKHPVSKLTSSCTFDVKVIAGSPPTVDFCPDTQIYTIEGRHQSVKATWEEPIFSDNVGVVTITKSNSPGTDFGAGSHLITYEAHDEAEWSSKCVFKIVVNVSKRTDVQHFQLPILYNRFYF